MANRPQKNESKPRHIFANSSDEEISSGDEQIEHDLDEKADRWKDNFEDHLSEISSSVASMSDFGGS